MKSNNIYCLVLVLIFSVSNLISQIQVNITAGSQSIYSSDWSIDRSYSSSFKCSAEIPFSQKFKKIAIVPHFRYQNSDLTYDFISYNHQGTGKFSEFFNGSIFEYGTFTDVKFRMNKFLFGVAFQHRIIDELYLSIGPGVSLNTYKNLGGLSGSNFHYYQIDLSTFKLPSNWNIFYSTNISYKFPLTERLKVIFGGEFIYHQAFSLDDLYIEKITQNSFHLEVGAGYRL